MRVNLYLKKKDEFGMEAVEQVGGLGRGEVERVGQNLGEGEVYEIPYVSSFFTPRLSISLSKDETDLNVLVAATPSPA